MIRITIEITPLEEVPSKTDEAQVTQLQDDMQEIVRRLIAGETSIIENMDGAPYITVHVEEGLK